jgi:hypothetical protein
MCKPSDETATQPSVEKSEANANKKTLVAPKQLNYELKPSLHYQYGIEMTSGDGGKGPWHLEGNVGYTLERENSRPASVMEQAKRRRQGGAAEKPRIAVRYLATLSGSQQLRNEMPMGTVSFTPEGEVVSVEAQSDFSMIAASTSNIVFERLPPPGVNRWKAVQQRTCGVLDATVVQAPTSVLNRLTGPGVISWRSYGSPITINRTVITTTAIDDETEYELVELDDSKAIVKTRFNSEMKFSSKLTGKIEGEGEYTFDRKQGVLTHKYAEYKVRLSADGVELTVPFQLAAILKDAITSEEMKARAEQGRRESAERTDKYRSDTATRKAQQLDESNKKLDKAIATLKDTSSSPDDAEDAFRDLVSVGRELMRHDRLDQSNKINHPQKAEISALLDRFLKSDSENARNKAVDAAEYWATAKNIPSLLAALESADNSHRRDIIKALGATGGNAKSATVLANLLETNTKYEAARALIGMKQYAEPAVLPLLQSKDSSTRREACSVLGDVGGSKSLKALEALATKSGKDDLQPFEVKQAIEKIKERLAVKSN